FYTLMSCFIATAVVSVLVMFFLVDRNDPPKNEEPVKAGTQQQVSQLLERLRKALAQLGFVACTSGIASVGLVMISYGVSQVVTGLLAGQAAARVGPAPVLLSALMGLLAMEVGSLFWEVLPQPEWPLHGMAVAWGAVDSVWVTLLNALYGEYFADNAGAAFSALRLWQSLGFIIGFSYNKLLCIEQKLYVMIGLLGLSAVTFVICVLINRLNFSVFVSLGVLKQLTHLDGAQRFAQRSQHRASLAKAASASAASCASFAAASISLASCRAALDEVASSLKPMAESSFVVDEASA
uniref:MFS_1_like domain-containing protein n=1 Tax=Macrostomum lignano TaxID=282301 RepID=A0A1I8IUJ0_9PLAT